MVRRSSVRTWLQFFGPVPKARSWKTMPNFEEEQTSVRKWSAMSFTRVRSSRITVDKASSSMNSFSDFLCPDQRNSLDICFNEVWLNKRIFAVFEIAMFLTTRSSSVDRKR